MNVLTITIATILENVESNHMICYNRKDM
jgi:hypothetical protein